MLPAMLYETNVIAWTKERVNGSLRLGLFGVWRA